MTQTSVIILITTICFLIYHFISSSPKTEQFFKNRSGNELGQMHWVLFNRLLGTLVFAFPAIYFICFTNITAAFLGLEFNFNVEVYVALFSIGILPVIINKYTANKTANLNMYPQIRVKVWTKQLVVVSAVSWMCYLLGYEILFRGLLFFFCLHETSLISAIAINISIYALVHLPKGFNEAIGSLLMGIVLCLLAYYAGSFWPAFILHSTLALSNEWYSLKYQPNMAIKK
jgi:membrane protease YdiL (CAAX protease family)